jgi:GTP diphosphokinase / guanosine-3',5'-bis(diphosphate) 3'-diphosphatase
MKSPRARLIKIADKTSNHRSILTSPPTDWSAQRKREYFDWAKQVVDRCRGINAQLEELFDRAYAEGMAMFTTNAA